METGYVRLKCALIESAQNVLSGRDVPVDMPIPPMRVGEIIHPLHMHKQAVKGVGRPHRPGRPAREPDIEEVRAQVLRRVAAMERGKARDAAARARDEAEFAARRR